MQPAAVGFQCPNCVKDGHKDTRSGRLPYGGERVANPALTSYVLIGINVAVWLLIVATGGASSSLVDTLALLPKTTLFGSPDGTVTLVRGVSDGAIWQVLTSTFTHIEVWHIGFNMMALYFLGPQLELILGRARFLALYLLSGLAGSVVVMWLSDPHTQTLGASGAIFGLMGALLVVALKIGSNVQQVFFWIVLNVGFTVVGASSISWQGHLGGLLGGAALAGIVVYAPKQNRAAFQWTGIALFGVACTVAILVRAVALS